MFLQQLWETHQVSVIVFLAVIGLIAFSNFLVIRRLGRYVPPADWPRVSVLIPARNEEKNISACLLSLLQQNYPDFELLVLDDSSTDRTPAILADLAKRFPRLTVLRGASLPDGWMGKHWACHQLAGRASGELLLFTDADTVYHPLALREMAAAAQSMQADMLAVIPHERVVSPAEQLVVPFFLWGVLAFLPVFLAYRLPWRALSFAVGQCMLLRRSAYDSTGGFEAVREDVVDDIALARRVKARGLRWRVVDGTQRVQCRMYHNWREVVEGFSKNTFPSFGYNLTIFLLAWIGMAIPLLEPFAVLLPGFNVRLPDRSLSLALLAVLITFLIWLVFYLRFRFPLYLAFFYPITIFLYTLIAFRSLYLTIVGQSTWKDRIIERKRVRII